MASDVGQGRSADRDLSSWKEIANFLGVSVRTAQVWEQERGLPVKRIPGPHGRVTTSSAALTLWKISGSSATIHIKSSPPDIKDHVQEIGSKHLLENVPVRLRSFPWGPAALSLVTCVLVTGWILVQDRRPASFKIEHGRFVVIDGRDQELWRKPTDIDDPAGLERVVWIGDPTGTGKTVVLFAPPRPYGEQWKLFCYAANGKELWTFTPGRSIRTAKETFRPPYSVHRVFVAQLGRRREPRVVVLSNHYLSYPYQVALLTPDGHLVREYWHSGHLNDIVTVDRRHDGASMLVLAGINNARHAATLVVLDPDKFSGAAVEENPDYQIQGMGPGIEEARFLFPRSCMNQKLEPYNIAVWVLSQPGGLTVGVQERELPYKPILIYHFGPDLHLNSVETSDWFLREHSILEASGQINHRFSQDEEHEFYNITDLRKEGAPSSSRH